MTDHQIIVVRGRGVENFRAKTIIYISECYRFSLLKCGFKLYKVRRMEVTGHSKYAVSSSIFIYTRNRIILHGLPRNRV